MAISGYGRVGIGTTAPSTPLHVIASGGSSPDQNGIYVYNPATTPNTEHAIISVRVKGNTAGNPYISYDVLGIAGWSTGIDNSDGQKFKISAEWASFASTRLTITRDGNVGIGTTSPTGLLELESTGSNGAAGILRFGSGGSGSIHHMDYYNDTGFTNPFWINYYSGADIILCGNGSNGSGNVAIGHTATSATYKLSVWGAVAATSYNATSDIRHKENVCDLENALEKINAIRGVNFNFKNDDTIHAGIIAQEVAEIIPEAICKGDDEKWSANYNTFIGYLIESVKTLSKENETLKTKVGSLESKLDMVMQHLNL
jgi:hypothetical protein